MKTLIKILFAKDAPVMYAPLVGLVQGLLLGIILLFFMFTIVIILN